MQTACAFGFRRFFVGWQKKTRALLFSNRFFRCGAFHRIHCGRVHSQWAGLGTTGKADTFNGQYCAWRNFGWLRADSTYGDIELQTDLVKTLVIAMVFDQNGSQLLETMS